MINCHVRRRCVLLRISLLLLAVAGFAHSCVGEVCSWSEYDTIVDPVDGAGESLMQRGLDKVAAAGADAGAADFSSVASMVPEQRLPQSAAAAELLELQFGSVPQHIVEAKLQARQYLTDPSNSIRPSPSGWTAAVAGPFADAAPIFANSPIAQQMAGMFPPPDPGQILGKTPAKEQQREDDNSPQDKLRSMVDSDDKPQEDVERQGGKSLKLPLYLHTRPGLDSSPVSQALGSSTLGDALRPTDDGRSFRGIDATQRRHVALIFGIIVLAIGSVLLHVMERCMPMLRYTVVVFLLGVLVAVLDRWLEAHFPAVFVDIRYSMNLWQTMDPHMLFFLFMPPLIFWQSVQVNTNLFARRFSQAVLLAGPGLLLNGLAVATIIRYFFPYGWDWPTVALLGFILAAIDPGEISSICREVNVSPRFAALIGGESLLNTGLVVVVFGFWLKRVLGVTLSAYDITLYFTHMIVTSICVGLLFGALAAHLLGLVATQRTQSAVTIQILLTVVCAYGSFYVSESGLSSSGMLSTLTAGLCLADRVWPYLPSSQAITIFWSFLETSVNIFIFTLAGVIFGNICMRGLVSLLDVACLFALYIVLVFVRMSIVFLFCLPIGEFMSLSLGNVRGAIVLVMAIIVHLEPGGTFWGFQICNLVFFHVCGVTIFSTLVNGMVMGSLLRSFGLADPHGTRAHVSEHLRAQVVAQACAELDVELRSSEDIRFAGASREVILRMAPSLAPSSPSFQWGAGEVLTSSKPEMACDLACCRLYREVFLRHLKNTYQGAMEDGVLYNSFKLCQVLFNSVNEALDKATEPLCDWQYLENLYLLQRSQATQQTEEGAAEARGGSLGNVDSTEPACATLIFLQGHACAQRDVPRLFSNGDWLDKRVVGLVHRESEEQLQRARRCLSLIRVDLVTVAKSKMLAQKVLQSQMTRYSVLAKEGVLLPNEELSLSGCVQRDSEELGRKPDTYWIQN